MSRADFNLPPINNSAVVDNNNSKKSSESYVKLSIKEYDNLKETLRKSEAEVSRLIHILNKINLPLNDIHFQPTNIKVDKYTDITMLAERYVVTFEIKKGYSYTSSSPIRDNF